MSGAKPIGALANPATPDHPPVPHAIVLTKRRIVSQGIFEYHIKAGTVIGMQMLSPSVVALGNETVMPGQDAKLIVAGSHKIGDVTMSSSSDLIAVATGVDLNTVGDTTTTLTAFAMGNFFVVDYVLATNASVSLTNAKADVWSGAGGTGQQYSGFSNNAQLKKLVALRDWCANGSPNATLGDLPGVTPGNGTMQNTAPIVHVITPQGAAATADFYVFGRVFP